MARHGYNMFKIAITPAAYEAILSTFPEDYGVDIPERTTQGNYFIWLPSPVLEAFDNMRGPKESTSDVILRFVKEHGNG